MTKPSLKKLIEILKNDKDIACYESNLERKCLHNLKKKSDFSTEVRNYLKVAFRGIEELERGIKWNKIISFQYGTEKYDLAVKGQKEIYSTIKDHLIPHLTALLVSFQNLEENVKQKIELTLYCGATSLSGNAYILSNEPIFLIPREDSTVIFMSSKRKKMKKGIQWTTDIVGDYPFAELKEGTTIYFTNNYFNYIYYVECAEEYPLEETVIPIVKKKYDHLFGE